MSSASDPKPAVVTGYPAAPPPAFSGGGAAYPYSAPPPYSGGGTGYPYGAPPPPPAAAYYGPSASHARLLRRLLYAAIGFFLLVGVATFVLWLALRPRLPAFAVSSAALSAFNTSSSSISADFDIALAVQNPNHKMSVYYDRAAAAVLYGIDTIAEASLPPFYQDKRNATTIRARLVAVGEYVDQDVVKGISSDRARGDGSVNFHVRLIAWVRFRAGAWRTRRHLLRVYCEDVTIGFKNGTAAEGSLAGGSPKECQVDL